MATYFTEPSRTFGEYLLVPGYSSSECIPSAVSLKTPLVKYRKGQEDCPLSMNIPMVSAIMQSVSNDTMAIALAKEGGVSFIYGSQSVEDEAAMVARVKSYKKGFIVSDSNVRPDATLADILALKEKTGHSTVAVTDDGTANGKLLGIVASRDYRISRMSTDLPVSEFMTPFEKLVVADEDTTLKEANDIIWDNKINSLPLIDKNQHLKCMVFRKDYDSHKENVNELLDKNKSYIVGAGINTRDYAERVPALVEAGADVLCIDSSEGFSEWQSRTISWIRAKYGDSVKVGAGNVVDREGFRFLAQAGADFVKIGIGGGSICITRETKGIGRGQATAVIEVAKARDEYFKETGVYVPICSDGGIVHDYHITLALAMGADFVMLGRYFSRFDESPTNKLRINGTYVKEYWGEGSNRARNWQRYDLGGAGKLSFEEGVDSYVPYAGALKDGVYVTLSKVRSTMCNCGALTIPELQEKARLRSFFIVGLLNQSESGLQEVKWEVLDNKAKSLDSNISNGENISKDMAAGIADTLMKNTQNTDAADAKDYFTLGAGADFVRILITNVQNVADYDKIIDILVTYGYPANSPIVARTAEGIIVEIQTGASVDILDGTLAHSGDFTKTASWTYTFNKSSGAVSAGRSGIGKGSTDLIRSTIEVKEPVVGNIEQ